MSYVICIILLVLVHFGLWKMFVKAGRPGWESLIPFYREYIIAQLTGRPAWWLILLLIPIVNIFIAITIYVDFVKSFGKRSFLEHAGTILLPFVVFPLWGTDTKTTYWGKSNTAEFKEKYPYKKTVTREWADAIIFAVVAATLIRGFLIEAYMIPTGSMEKSLLVGDFIFVSKVNYGPRVPMTPVAFPFSHHTLPTGGKAYWEGIKLDYKRLPGFEKIERNDVVVFNYPPDGLPPLSRPVDKRENYIKRCIAIPGDSLRIIDSKVYVNGQAEVNPPESQTSYYVKTNGTDLNPQTLFDMRIEGLRQSETEYVFTMTDKQAETISSWANVEAVKPNIAPLNAFDGQVFPHNPDFPWNVDNFGPIVVPEKGWTVALDSTTVPLYEQIITDYEGNTFEQRADGYYINSEKADSYTFQMDYYWMMGDNRHSSADSRLWGFVPEDHIVGKALFVWLSLDEVGSFFDKVRWNRIFMKIE
ncbi:signal peptidase I [Albibacterium indicum]|uniref:signal peptidase I n=1 Tax=Albibacterium indicum TaxID=2292082 RepID=UPI000E529B87|nr:signal peptidase I [Pedobacter indicus]